MHGGTCVDRPNSFTCDCASGWSGQLCQEQVDACATQPCHNNGTCVGSNTGFTCECQPNFVGATCDIPLDYCITQPCQNGGTCVNGVTSYTCRCDAAFAGDHCERAVGTIPPAQTLVVTENSFLPLQISLIVCLGVGLPLLVIIVVLLFLLHRRRRNINNSRADRASRSEAGARADDVDWDNIQNTEIAGRMNNNAASCSRSAAADRDVVKEVECDVSTVSPQQYARSKNILNINNLNSAAKETNKDSCSFGQKRCKADNLTAGLQLDRCVLFSLSRFFIERLFISFL